MPGNAFADALSGLAARLGPVVREHEVLRVSATVLGDEPAKSAGIARHEVLNWARKRCGGNLPRVAWEFQDFEYLAGGRNSVGVRVQTGDSDIWAIRADDPDKSVPGRVWTTEAVVRLQKGERPNISARLLASTSEDELNVEPHTPGFVQQLCQRCGLSRGAYPLSAEPAVVSTADDAEALIAKLINPARRLPVFVLTVPEDAANPEQPLLDAATLARATLGMGHVTVLPAVFTWKLTQEFQRVRSVFGGAVRAYLPGFDQYANPYAHRLVLADQLATDDGKAQCVRWMRSLAAAESVRRNALGADVLAFAEIRNANLENTQRRLASEGASERAQLDAASARIQALEKQLAEKVAYIEYCEAEHGKMEERAEAAEEQARASAGRIQELENQIEARSSLPAEWKEFKDWCDARLAGRVVLSPRARRNVRDPEFEDVELAARCLLWLADECWPARIEGGQTLGEAVVEPGIRNSHCGADQFDLEWQGRRHTADWHIKTGGNTKDPKRCLRIYYFWDSMAQQVVVADMPAHRRTDAT